MIILNPIIQQSELLLTAVGKIPRDYFASPFIT